MKKFLYFLLAIVTLASFGCTGDSSTFMSSIGTPNPNKFQPKGTVTGVLVDACTNDPIANADVYIMDRKATTNSVGMFTIKNVPANTSVGNETANSGLLPVGSGTSLLSNGLATWDTYNVVIDMTRLNAQRAKDNLTVYPNIAYHTVKVSYTSLGETDGEEGTATNHDTPVDGFVANIKPMVGKLAANINVQVVNGIDATPLNGASVQLISLSPIDGLSDPNNFTGDLVNTISTKTTATVGGTVGVASFTNIESKHFYYAKVTYNDAVTKHVFTGHQIVWAECDGTTTNFFLAGPNPAIPVYDAADNVDTVAPFVQSVIPANLSDIAPSGTTQVVFTFSEVLKADAYLLATTESTSASGGIFKDVAVNYTGPKAGNVPYTMAWDSTTSPKVLTITLATAASSKYTVSVAGALANIKDLNGNTAVASAAATTNFTTSGGLNVDAPVISRVGTSNTISWLPVTNAYAYRVYMAQNRDGVTGAYTFVAETGFTTYDLGFLPWNDGETKLSYSVYVVTINTDNAESVASNLQLIDDKTAPSAFINPASVNPTGAYGANEAKSFTLIVDFNEVMDKATVLTLGNWTAVMTVSGGGPISFAATGVTVTYPTNFSTRVTISYTLTNGATAQNLTGIQFSTTAKDLNGNTTSPTQFGSF